MLTSEFERSGNFLFRWRSYVPLFVIVVAGVGLSHFRYPFGSHWMDTAWDFFCYGISLGGLAFRIMTIGFVQRDTSGRNTKEQLADALNTTGTYSMMRHPLYFGNFWMWFGAALFPRQWWVVVIVCLAFMVVYERIMFAEERYLMEKFGDAYMAWSKETPAFWPRIRNWVRPEHPFSIKSVLRRENASLLGITTIFYAMEVFSTYIAEGVLELDVLWTAVFLFSLALYVVLKVMKKLKLLREPGR